MRKNSGFCEDLTLETNLLILDYYDELKREEKNKIKVTRKEERTANRLIRRYNELIELSKIKDDNYKIVVINGKKILISKYEIRKKDLRTIENAIVSNSFDNKAEYKKISEGRRKKRYKVYRIKRFARLLMVAKEESYDMYKEFLQIPDVRYIISNIKKDEFGDYSKFMGYV